MDVDAEAQQSSWVNRKLLKRNIDDVYRVSILWSRYVAKLIDVEDGRKVVISDVCSRMNTMKVLFLTSDRIVVGVFCGTI